MIDTIRIKIVDLLYHKQLKEFLERRLMGEGQSKQFIATDTKDFHETFLKSKIYGQSILYHDTNNEIPIKYFNKLKSYYYDISYEIDHTQDCLRIEFSIPKYLYGTNIYMLTPHRMDAIYSLDNRISNRFNRSLKDLKNFLRYFFNKEFGQLKPDFGLVILERIDFCYNQVFNTTEDALEYMNQQKQVYKKYQRESSDSQVNYVNSIHYRNKMYSFKIYHKGSEYKLHDYKELKNKISKNQNAANLEFANRTLRYEITFRNSYLSYSFNRDKYLKDLDPVLRSYINNPDSKKSRKLKLTSYQKAIVNSVRQDLRKTRSFAISELTKHQFNLLYKQFKKNYDNFQISYELKSSENYHEVIKHIVEEKQRFSAAKGGIFHMFQKNSSSNNINISKFKFLIELLKIKSFDEIKKEKLMPERTLYRYKKFMVSQGFKENQSFSLQVVVPKDCTEYFTNLSLLGLENSVLMRTFPFYKN